MHQAREEEDALRSMSHRQLGSALPRISTGKAANQRTGFLNLTTLPGETQRQYIVKSTPAYSREIQSETNSYNAFTS
jgi:hypothetical protein